MSLKEYIRKRNFKKTAEPSGKHIAEDTRSRFAIQKHDASRLHYDFRLEIGGVLKSWAVPKGIPFAKGEKRLAVQVEDHPVSYIDFEGVIPRGQYGGGTVMVWDRGAFEPMSSSPKKELASGKLHFILMGKKLHGEWYLVRLREETQWLLIKGNSSQRPVSKKQDDTSALSGKSMRQLSASNHVWQSNRRNGRPAGGKMRAVAQKASLQSGRFIEPMKARLVETAPIGKWIYEVKFDGFRAMANKVADEVKLTSRNGKDLSGKFPEIANAIGGLDAGDAVIDGEIVALDSKGRSSFQLLQASDLGERHPPICYYAFDLLRLNGKDFMDEPLGIRKSHLEILLKNAPENLRYSGSLGGDAGKLLPKVRQLGLEGLIGKRTASHYEPGRRSGAWVKLKLRQEQEMVIGGYTEPKGSQPYFGALLIGCYQGKELRFAGKVGTGFNGSLLASLNSSFRGMASPRCPFANLPEPRASARGQNITPAEMKRCHWLKPRMVCQVGFSEWTRDGKLRQPVFLGLRNDKNAGEVVREKPQ